MQVIRADPTLTGVMGKTAAGRPRVQRLDRVGRQRPEAHRRNVQQRDLIRLAALGPAQPYTGVQVVGESCPQRVTQELIADRIQVALGSERLIALGAFGPFVDHVAGLTVERRRLGVGLDEILPDLRAD